jgi:saccharopine dehydrogenase-like NADP-dependent oxidoreductase
MRLLLLGAGRVGAAIARNLAPDFDVTAADTDGAALARLQADGFRTRTVSVTDPEALAPLLDAADLVVGAVPGPLGFETLRRVLEAGRNVVDISFFEQDAFALDGLARARGCTAIVDCGVAPGCSNLLLGRHAAAMERVDRFWCAVGGLPVVRTWPFEYQAPFSPIDVIAEYTRPARFRRAGRDVTLPALSEVELLELPGVGTVEAFNTDGLRSLLSTMPVPDMVEKTLRYPGHAERMRMLRETGFFSEQPLALGTVSVAPLALTARLLIDAWRFAPGEADLTVMRVLIEGLEGGRRVRHTYDLLDHYDAATDTSSMARTTGYTCAAAVRLLASGGYRRAGVTPPELLGEAGAGFMLADLERFGVRFSHSVTELGPDA